MKVATLWLEMTSHSTFLTLSTDSGTSILRSSLTLTWQPSLQLSLICFLLKNPVSVGRMFPPPSRTLTLHCPQLALPPQADGRKIFSSARAPMSELPGATSSTLLPPLMSILTVPLGVSFVLTHSSRTTRISVTTVIVATEAIIVRVISFIFQVSY